MTASDDGSAGSGHAVETASTADAQPTFETVELGEGTTRWRPAATTATFVAGATVLVALATYHLRVLPEGTPLYGSFVPSIIDWLYWLSTWSIVSYLVVPMIRSRGLVAHYWRHLRRNRVAVASLIYLGLFGVVATVGPHVVGGPAEPVFGTAGAREPLPSQPPVGFSVSNSLVFCGENLVDGRCVGTWQYPLGTTATGDDVLSRIVHGMNVALKVVVISGTLMVPLGVGVGTIAGYVGGRVDDALMRYVDVQQVLPAFFIVLLFLVIHDGGLLLLVLVFGLLNWGGIARLVRSDALKTREEGFVWAARSAGARPLRIVRRHIVPNTSSTILTAITLQLPLIVIMETTLAYLFSRGRVGAARASIWQVDLSWGWTIALGFSDRAFPTLSWWVALAPGILLLATTVSLSLLGDAMRDALDPRVER
ncbi:ABC transporter permease [Haloparvum sp. PAK95]|uniref:ABC transporter permease n=1 Tax=Haloparvum sp. PAK95 TaxID=3418962 RepID=UPI003D2EF210